MILLAMLVLIICWQLREDYSHCRASFVCKDLNLYHISAKLPKNYDPDVIPDPERWLPRRERSYYRGKRKDKKRDIGKGSQGATSTATEL